MSVSEILESLIYGDLPRSVEVFGPEIVLCVTVVSLLLLRLFGLDRMIPSYLVALGGSVLAFVGILAQFVFLTAAGDETGGSPLGAGEALFDLFLLTQGYAIMDGASMPIIGADPNTVNDTFGSAP